LLGVKEIPQPQEVAIFLSGINKKVKKILLFIYI